MTSKCTRAAQLIGDGAGLVLWAEMDHGTERRAEVDI